MGIRQQLLSYQQKVRRVRLTIAKLTVESLSADSIRTRLLKGLKADGSYLPTYAKSTLARKGRTKTLYGDGIHWSLKESGGFHLSIAIVAGKPKATFKKGISLLLSSHKIRRKDILGL